MSKQSNAKSKVNNLIVIIVGKGLGKQGDGRSNPVKCNLKFDKTGIGYDEEKRKKDNDHWWVGVYNSAASQTKESTSEEKNTLANSFFNLTDKQLFEACGGRTAHRAARHGIKQNGKLKRLQEQETKNKVKNFNERKTRKKHDNITTND